MYTLLGPRALPECVLDPPAAEAFAIGTGATVVPESGGLTGSLFAGGAWHRHLVSHVLPELRVQGPLVGHVVFSPLDGALRLHEVAEGALKPSSLQSARLTLRLHLNQNHLGIVLDEGTVQGHLLLIGELLAV